MNIVAHLQELDKLIIENTSPDVTALLRNKLSFVLEQAEAHSEAVAKQEKTLSAQMETIERLAQEKEDADSKYSNVISENANLKTELSSFNIRPEDAGGGE